MDDPDLVLAGRLRGEPPVQVEERGPQATERWIRGRVLVHDHEQVDKAHGRPGRRFRGFRCRIRIARLGRLLPAPPGYTRQRGAMMAARRPGADPAGTSPAASAGAASWSAAVPAAWGSWSRMSGTAVVRDAVGVTFCAIAWRRAPRVVTPERGKLGPGQPGLTAGREIPRQFLAPLPQRVDELSLVPQDPRVKS